MNQWATFDKNSKFFLQLYYSQCYFILFSAVIKAFWHGNISIVCSIVSFQLYYTLSLLYTESTIH